MLATLIHANTSTAQVLFIIAMFAGVIYTAVEIFALRKITACLGLAVTLIAAGLIFAF